MEKHMAALQAASRIVDIQAILTEGFLGTPKREALMTEQRTLWNQHFEGRPYDEIAKDAWAHKHLFRW